MHRRVYQSAFDVKKNGCAAMYGGLGTLYWRGLP